MATPHTPPPGDAPIPLRSWMKNELAAPNMKRQKDDDVVEGNNSTPKNDDDKRSFNESIIRRTTIAYGIAELFKHSSNRALGIDDFEVSVSSEKERPPRSWDDIKGVGMISSGLSVTIEEPSYLRGLLEGEEDCDGQMGRCLEVELASDSTPPSCEAVATLNNVGQSADMRAIVEEEENNRRCYLFARILYELFTHEPFPNDDALEIDAASTKEPAQKRAKPSHDVSSRKKLMLTRAKGDFDRAGVPFQIQCIAHMQNLGVPASICLMTQNLLECALRHEDGAGGQLYNAYESLGVVCEDLHLLLLDPDRFLFDNPNHDSDDMQLLYRTDKLYGRDKEETLITDAFCRVSRGKSEAFFIGGFSGSGKSMLVNSLRDRVNAVGGYTIKHKFDAMSREKPLSGVISALNQVCQMIKGTDKPVIAKRLRDEFGVDFSLLTRLLPNVRSLSATLKVGERLSETTQAQSNDSVNVRSVSFTLLRFVRVVSNPRHPIMLFLDDVQWADSTALDVIHTILSDTMGSCMFFVGTYRDNEVQIDHPVFDLVDKLETSNVLTTKVSLAGLNREDLNKMISDALCLYPRICKSLSDILFQKTKGNPFFLLEFMQSLKSRGLLQYNSHQKRWVWNEDIIRTENITDNVLYLLSSKMNSLLGDVQTVLKVMACFGSSTNERVIGYLSESAEYAGVRNGLEGALSDGFIVKDGEGRLQFVHDKVREAAYELIPGSDKKEFHYQLGTVLNSSCDGNDVEDAIFIIASQINRGKEWIVKDRDLRVGIAELNMKAGKRALDGCDFRTAYSYLITAISLLPEDHWESLYDLSLRLNFMLARAANSCCQYDEAEQLLRRGLSNARCLDDQLPSHLLLSQILQAHGKAIDVYDTCSSILVNLGESTPESCTLSTSELIAETLNIYEELGNKWLEGEKTDDKTLNRTLQIYSACIHASFMCKSFSKVVYHTCKALQLSLHRGLCEHSLITLAQFSSIVTKHDTVELTYRIARNALSLHERFGVAAQVPELYSCFYGRIAWHFESFHVCAENLRRGFETGLSTGNSDVGLQCAFHAIKFGMVSGANLKSTLKEIDYYLHLLKTYKNANFKNLILNSRETVSLLIDNGEATGIEEKAVFGDSSDKGHNMFDALLYYHQAFRAYWSGYTDQCRYYSEKHLAIKTQELQLFIRIQVDFYHGLNSVDKLRVKKSDKWKEVVRKSITAMRKLALNSDWNYTNKLELLEAEQQSLRGNYRNANRLYDASIASARKSGFIHEQGLACEKAGLHYERLSNVYNACKYLKQARECYEEWGSSMKVDAIQAKLDNLQTILHKLGK